MRHVIALAVPTLVMVLGVLACPTGETCSGQQLPDGGGIAVCGEGPSCDPCWSCHGYGGTPGWVVLPGMCDGGPSDGSTNDG